MESYCRTKLGFNIDTERGGILKRIKLSFNIDTESGGILKRIKLSFNIDTDRGVILKRKNCVSIYKQREVAS